MGAATTQYKIYDHLHYRTKTHDFRQSDSYNSFQSEEHTTSEVICTLSSHFASESVCIVVKWLALFTLMKFSDKTNRIFCCFRLN